MFLQSNASEVNKCYDKTVFLLTVTSKNCRFYYQLPYGFDRNFNFGFNRYALAFCAANIMILEIETIKNDTACFLSTFYYCHNNN